MHLKYASLFFLHIYFFTIFVAHFRYVFAPGNEKIYFLPMSAAENAEVVQGERNKPNFRASEWENLFSRNERRRKCGIYEINAELAQLVEQLIRNE